MTLTTIIGIVEWHRMWDNSPFSPNAMLHISTASPLTGMGAKAWRAVHAVMRSLQLLSLLTWDFILGRIALAMVLLHYLISIVGGAM